MYLDIFIAVVAVYALWKGWLNGMLRELVSTLGFIAGLIVACLCYSLLGKYLAVNGTKINIITSIIAFFLLWIIVPISLGAVATSLTKGLKRIGSLSVLNRIGGALVSMAKYLLLMSFVLSIMQGLGILSKERQEDSRLLGPVTAVTTLFTHSVVEAATTTTINNTEVQTDTIWVDVRPCPTEADSAATPPRTK